MARKRGRRMAMTAAGLATAAAPLLFGQQVAGAAITTAQDSKLFTYQGAGGRIIDCTAGVSARHNTDDPTQPRLEWTTFLANFDDDCERLSTTVTATYKDSDGVSRTVTSFSGSLTNGSVTGASTATTVSVKFRFINCLLVTANATCDVTVTASPK